MGVVWSGTPETRQLGVGFVLILSTVNQKGTIMGRADVYVQPHAADPVLADAVVLDLVRRHAPRAKAVTSVDESGGEARAYFVDDDLVFKTQRPHRLRPRTSLAKEAYLLDELAAVLDSRVPRLLGYDQVDTAQGRVEYVCMTRIHGHAARHATVAGDTRRALLVDLAAVLRGVHSTPVDPTRLPTDSDTAALRQRLAFGFGDIADTFAEHATTPALPIDLNEVIDRALAAVPDTLTAVVLHSNPSPTHVFVEPGTGQFTGVIDFGDAYASHPALDLHRWPDAADRIVLHDSYLDGIADTADFDRMWTIAMIYTDLAVIATGSPFAESATADLAGRVDDL
jgi:aminoglycoside phosphotransferase (APT) family kinase protein